MTNGWIRRRDSAMPYQRWCPFHPDALVQVKNAYGETRVDATRNMWWGYETELGDVSDGVIMVARQVVRRGKPVYRVPAGFIKKNDNGNTRISR